MPVRSWRRMLGHMSDLEKFVPGARLRMRPFQFFIRTVRCGDVLIPFPTELRKNLVWWMEEERLKRESP